MMRLLSLVTLVMLGCSRAPVPPAHPTPATPAGQPVAYSLEGTEVLTVHARELHRDYQLFVSLPASYDKSTNRYPVLFVTDANYAFPLIRSIAKRVGNRGKDLEEFILVGLSYAVGETPEFSRRRDYTPTPKGLPNSVSDMPGRTPIFGGAEAYRRFLADDVLPFVAQHYRADMQRTVYAGHSFGSLLGTHILLTSPTMFQRYILGSPSYWYDRETIFAQEAEWARTHGDLPAQVFMAVGAFETVRNEPHYNHDDDMVGDMQTFEKRLLSHKYPNLHVQSVVLADEDHLTVFPGIITRGMLWAFGPKH